MKHVVIHQDNRGGISFHECHMVWTIQPRTAGVVVSRILTGSKPAVHYGSDDPIVQRRVDRHKRRIDRGEHFARGDILSRTPRIGRDATSRLRPEKLPLIGELHYALAAQPRFVVLSEKTEDGRCRYQSVPGSAARWADYVAAHRLEKRHARARALRSLLEEILPFCEAGVASPDRRQELRESFYPVLSMYRRTRGEGERAYYSTAETLSMALAAEVLGFSVRTLSRRIWLDLENPGSYGYG